MSKSDLNLDHFLTEKETQEFFGLKKEQLGELRRKKGLPFIRISKTQRLYFEKDLIDWLLTKRFQSGLEMDSKPYAESP